MSPEGSTSTSGIESDPQHSTGTPSLALNGIRNAVGKLRDVAGSREVSEDGSAWWDDPLRPDDGAGVAEAYADIWFARVQRLGTHASRLYQKVLRVF